MELLYAFRIIRVALQTPFKNASLATEAIIAGNFFCGHQVHRQFVIAKAFIIILVKLSLTFSHRPARGDVAHIKRNTP